MDFADWRVVFAGTPRFAVASLDALVARGIEPVAVLTQPDRPAGRGRRVQPSPVAQRAMELGLPLRQPTDLRDERERVALADLHPDLMVVVAYGVLLPPALLAMPRLGCINVHASLLPRWRGASPIQHAILSGDTETGISIMQMDSGLDTGPVLWTRRIEIEDDDTAGSLQDRLAVLGGEALIEGLDGLAAGCLQAVPQDATRATQASRLRKQDAWLDFSQDARVLWRRIRAFDPWPVAQARLGDETIRVWRAVPYAATGEPGQVLAADGSGVLVACGQGSLRLLEVQRPGGKRIAAGDWANAQALSWARFSIDTPTASKE